MAPSISIHALLAESDRSTIRWGDVYSQFQSTLSLRRATWNRTTSVPFSLFQSTLSLRRATDFVPAISSLIEISIHALLAESDLDLGIYRFECRHFNPRSPCGERQDAWIGDGEVVQISIHALLAESDFPISPGCLTRGHFNPRSPCGERRGRGRFGRPVFRDFNPRSPCGERPSKAKNWPAVLEFQSTLSLRRAT